MTRWAQPMLVAVVFGAFAASHPGSESRRAQNADVTRQTDADLASHALIRRDTFGVPHIVADSEAAAAFAQGYATAEDHGPALARLFLRARGAEASVFGDAFVESDVLNHELGIYDIAAERFGELPPFMQLMLDGYAAGYDRCLERRCSQFPDWATRISGVDVLAHARAVLLLDFALDLRLWTTATRRGTGSMMWAIGGALTKSGHPMLLANPHVPWDGDMLFHEV
jgi:acyl-homoserine-lactone acylase